MKHASDARNEYYQRAGLLQRWSVVQEELIPGLGQEVEGLTPKLTKLIHTLEWARIEDFVAAWQGIGRPPKDRCALANGFVAKAVLGLTTTVALIDRLTVDRALRRICGFSRWKKLPDEATFSRAFAEPLRRDGCGLLQHRTAGALQRPRARPACDHNPRGGEKIEFDPAEAVRYNERTVAERMSHGIPLRINARLKDEFGGNPIWVKGNTRVMSHLMFGLLVLTVDQLMRLLQ